MSKYEEIPRPLVEEHYHIRELIEGQEKRTADRNYHRQKQKDLQDREDYIIDSKLVTITDFYCVKCGKDFKAQSIRQIETDWSNPKQRIAFYKTKCEQGHWNIRLITDRNKDPFFFKSKLLAKDRANHMLDIMQPDQIGYKTLYGYK